MVRGGSYLSTCSHIPHGISFHGDPFLFNLFGGSEFSLRHIGFADIDAALAARV